MGAGDGDYSDENIFWHDSHYNIGNDKVSGKCGLSMHKRFEVLYNINPYFKSCFYYFVIATDPTNT